MQLPTTLTSRLRNDSGQAAVEFALVLPLLLAVVFLITGFARVFNEYNDLNQMAADGARFAAVGNFPGAPALLHNADTALSKAAIIAGPTYSGASGSTCAVGQTVTVTATADLRLIPFLTFINNVVPAKPTLQGKAEMRVERCPTTP